MSAAGFEPTISAGERTQTYALDRATTWTGIYIYHADDLVLLAKEEKVLQDMTDKLIEIGGCYGM